MHEQLAYLTTSQLLHSSAFQQMHTLW